MISPVSLRMPTMKMFTSDLPCFFVSNFFVCCEHFLKGVPTLTDNRDGNVHSGRPQFVLHLQGVDALVGLDTVVNDEGGVQVGAGDVQPGSQGLDLLQRLVLLQPLHLRWRCACDGDAHLDGVSPAEAQTFAVVWGQVNVSWSC